MSQRDLKPVALTRRLAPAKGDLVPVAAGGASVAPDSNIKMFLEALRAGDRPTLSRLAGGNDFAAERLFAGDTAIADLKQPVERPMQIFTLAAPKDNVAAVACWCRTKDCAKKWPIALRDADNQISRPYACVRQREYRQGEDNVVRYDASQNFDGLPEPR
jgi:hypothetical protein